jgi:hypothetical protein
VGLLRKHDVGQTQGHAVGYPSIAYDVFEEVVFEKSYAAYYQLAAIGWFELLIFYVDQAEVVNQKLVEYVEVEEVVPEIFFVYSLQLVNDGTVLTEFVVEHQAVEYVAIVVVDHESKRVVDYQSVAAVE